MSKAVSDDIKIIDLTPDNIAEYGVCGYKDVQKHLELRRKIDWVKKYYPKGLRIKALIHPEGGYQGMIEYIPGEYAHRPVKAEGYMFIHCLFVGFRKEYKGRGYASLLIEECIKESRNSGYKGVAVVARRGSFMADSGIFINNNFKVSDSSKPDFELLVNKFDDAYPNPEFRKIFPEKFSMGLYIFRSAQCPYTVKNVDAIIKAAEEKRLNSQLIELSSHEQVQESPSPFGSFGIIHDGKILSYHPISVKRFENIINK